MKNQYLSNSLKAAALAAAMCYCAGARATVATVATLSGANPGQQEFQSVAFRDSTEAGILRNAYAILATGDHDYKGHRARAMKSVEAAAKLLDMDLAGDLKDHTPQALSDAKLREAQDMITKVLASAEVKSQKKVVNHLTKAVNEISTALSVR